MFDVKTYLSKVASFVGQRSVGSIVDEFVTVICILAIY